MNEVSWSMLSTMNIGVSTDKTGAINDKIPPKSEIISMYPE